jgi:hypothetical protein
MSWLKTLAMFLAIGAMLLIGGLVGFRTLHLSPPGEVLVGELSLELEAAASVAAPNAAPFAQAFVQSITHLVVHGGKLATASEPADQNAAPIRTASLGTPGAQGPLARVSATHGASR